MMRNCTTHEKVTASDKAIIKAMAESVYWCDGAYFPNRAEEWREAYEHICDNEAYEALQEELARLFGEVEASTP